MAHAPRPGPGPGRRGAVGPAVAARARRVLFLALLAGGLLAAFALKPPLYRDAHALGLHAVGLLVPYVAAMAFAVGTLVLGRLDRPHILATVALFACLTLPFADLFTSPIVHFEKDDSFRYSVAAHYMLDHRTLWGSGSPIHGSPHFVEQPGYRYYLAAAIALVRGEHRGLQLFNMGALLAAALWTLRVLQPRLDARSAVAGGVFLLASAPYAAKNILYGYSEWLAVALFMVYACAFLTRRITLAMVVLALVPFVRQNLLPVSLVMAGFTLFQTGRWRLVAPYLAVLGLPLYHNLYYAGEWRFMVENTGALVRFSGHPAADLAAMAEAAGSRLLAYSGYHPTEKALTNAVALLFVPFGTALVIWCVAKVPRRQQLVLVAAGVATVGPTLLYGSGSPPRFEFVNLSVVLLTMMAVCGWVRRD